jgi:hypothetical protein
VGYAASSTEATASVEAMPWRLPVQLDLVASPSSMSQHASQAGLDMSYDGFNGSWCAQVRMDRRHNSSETVESALNGAHLVQKLEKQHCSDLRR